MSYLSETDKPISIQLPRAEWEFIELALLELRKAAESTPSVSPAITRAKEETMNMAHALFNTIRNSLD